MYFAPTFPSGSGSPLEGHTVQTIKNRDAPALKSAVTDQEHAKLMSQFEAEANAAANALEFRKAVALRLGEFAPKLRRSLMTEAIDRFTARAKPRTWPKYGAKKLPEPMHKGHARGGAYHARIQDPSGRYVYVYTKAEYDRRPDAHVNGEKAREEHVHHHVARILEKSDEATGCPVDSFRPLVERHGAAVVAKALRGHNVHFDGTHVHRKKPKAAPKPEIESK